MRNLPEHSSTKSTPNSSQATSPGLPYSLKLRGVPSITTRSPSASTSGVQRPCTESNLSKWAAATAPPLISLIWTNSSSGQPQAARNASRPILPNPLIPTRIVMSLDK